MGLRALYELVTLPTDQKPVHLANWAIRYAVNHGQRAASTDGQFAVFRAEMPNVVIDLAMGSETRDGTTVYVEKVGLTEKGKPALMARRENDGEKILSCAVEAFADGPWAMALAARSQSSAQRAEAAGKQRKSTAALTN